MTYSDRPNAGQQESCAHDLSRITVPADLIASLRGIQITLCNSDLRRALFLLQCVLDTLEPTAD